MATKVTEHFTLEEFACRDGNPYPEIWVKERLSVLCAQLEILRQELGAPISINSGYRTETYNKKIGGAKLSQHVQGRAADIQVKGKLPTEVHATVLRLYKLGKLKIGGLGKYPNFIHLDVRPSDVLVQWTGGRSSN